jgi:3',5'-cyclic AMP phosphodiesterase CpdA
MQSSNPPFIAVIADPHFHDLSGNYGAAGIDAKGRRIALRPLADTVKSTRVFNEAGGALKHVLHDIVARGIRHVVLLGDYSDDGQAETLKGLRALFEDCRQRHGLRFFAVPGNHDIFGPHGRHRSKRFLNPDFSHVLATSNPDRRRGPEEDAIVTTEGMRCLGYPDGLLALPGVGFFRDPDDRYWETPFGLDDAPAARRYQVRSADGQSSYGLMDASYLVEPVEGVWLLMIDANVFVPLSGTRADSEEAFADSTDAGWNAMLTHKRFVLDWTKDVSARAKRSGKTLIAFSHYPALDPLDGTGEDEFALLGETSLSRRLPGPDVGRALIEAGIRVHFSGHVHINDTARMREASGFLVNVSVPSLVAFPPAYKIVRVEPERLTVETVSIGAMTLDQDIMDIYRAEASKKGLDAAALLAAEDYGAFLSAHLGHLVGRRHLRREWPEELAHAVRPLDLLDLAVLALTDEPLLLRDLPDAIRIRRQAPDIAGRLAACAAERNVDLSVLSRKRVMAFLGDWYRAKMGSDFGRDAIAPGDLDACRLLCWLYAENKPSDGTAQAAFARIFRMFGRYITGLPSGNFTIDLVTGDIEAS